MEKLTVHHDGRPCYDIVFTDGFAGLADAVLALGFAGRRIAVITESTVAPLYLDAVLAELSAIPGEHIAHTFPAGEENKHLDTVGGIYETLIRHHFDRHDLLIALGGGVTGDITGFAAASFLRGISFLQIPTTLLAQCDSSIGGKTGVDFKGYKNMVGAFYMPRLVWMNLATLKTLDGRQFVAGFAEVIKHGMIRDRAYFDWLLAHRDGILAREVAVLLPMIRMSSDIKRQVVEEDPREQGVRATLNFGHTIGHAIEKYRDFRLYHGECVSLGMSAAAAISAARGWITGEERAAIVTGLRAFGLPVTAGEAEALAAGRLPSAENGSPAASENVSPAEGAAGHLREADRAAILGLVRSDKKMDGGHIRFILLHPLGHARIAADVTEEELGLGLEAIA